ncbi:MAG: dihydroneopterin aldolase [Deltaproteobacteria bacterium]|nr:dihydroneopterin aldolase [Deltaproteobacteria bacterium]
MPDHGERPAVEVARPQQTVHREPRTSDRILLQGIGFVGRHGVYPQEQLEGQPFEVDLEVARCCARAAATDRLEDTVDYAQLAGLVLEIGTGQSFQLLERLAGAISEAVLQRHPDLRLTVTVRKFPPGLPGSPRCASVTLTRGPLPPAP